MLRTGKVIGAENGEIEVSFQRPEACAHCGACHGQKEETRIRMPGNVPAGRWVDVDMPEAQVLKASVLAYALPLALLLAGMGLGSLIFESEELWGVCGIALMGCSWFILRRIEKRMKSQPRWQPKIVSVHEEGWEAPTACGK